MAEVARQAGVTPARPGWWTPAVAVQMAVLALLLLIPYRYVVYRLVHKWINDGDWSHGFIIPLFGLYYLYLQRHRMPTGLARRTQWGPRLAGAAVVLLGFGLFVFSTLYRLSYPQSVALVVTLAGVVLMACGWAWTRWSWFAIAFLMFALPVPNRLYVQMTMPLRFIAADVSAVVLNMGIPDMEATPSGAVVEYIYQGKTGTLDIEHACSGIRLLMTMMALGVAMAFVSERPLWHRLIMILSCLPIAIFCNIIRVTTTGFFVVLGRDDLSRGFAHTMLGLSMLFIAFGLFGLISYVLNHLFEEHEPAESAGA